MEKLTKREIEILENLSLGLTNQEIADKMIVSKNTINVYLHKIYEKLDLLNFNKSVQRLKAVLIFHQLTKEK